MRDRVERVEGAEGLVHQKYGGVVDEGPGEVGAVAHAARELMRVSILEPGQPDGFDHDIGLLAKV